MKARSLLVDYYKKKRCSKVDQLTVAMLGPRKRPELHAQVPRLTQQANRDTTLVPEAFVASIIATYISDTS